MTDEGFMHAGPGVNRAPKTAEERGGGEEEGRAKPVGGSGARSFGWGVLRRHMQNGDLRRESGAAAPRSARSADQAHAVLLHELPAWAVHETAVVLNAEWPRSLSARMQSIQVMRHSPRSQCSSSAFMARAFRPRCDVHTCMRWRVESEFETENDIDL